MDKWIEGLWNELRTADYGTADLIGTIWDLECLADRGLVSRERLERELVEREQRDLAGVRDEVKRKWNVRAAREWTHVVSGSTFDLVDAA